MSDRRYKLLIIDQLYSAAMQRLYHSGLFEISECSDISDKALSSKIISFDAVITHVRNRFNSQTIQAASNLKFIGCASVGFDHVDMAAAGSRSIVVETAAGGNAQSVGDLALLFMLNFGRNLILNREILSNGHWDRKAITGFALEEKTLGIVGLGNTGLATAKRAKGFDMKIIGFDPLYSANALLPPVDSLMPDLETLVTHSDIISFHIPLNDSTKHLVGRELLKKVTPGSYIINTSRGGIVDEAALQNALDNNRLSGYATDVFDREPPANDHWMRNHPKVVATQHVGGATLRAKEQISLRIAEKAIDFFSTYIS